MAIIDSLKLIQRPQTWLVFVSKEKQARWFILSDFPLVSVDRFSQLLNKLPYSTTRKCGLASQSINTHGDFLEVKKNKADDVDELWDCVRDLSESSFGDAE